MDEERGKEYYQVHLDTGRIFWIAFLLGLVLIGIFVLGFYIGEEKKKGDLLELGNNDLLKEQESLRPAYDELTEELDLSDKNLEAETRYIDVKSFEADFEEFPKPSSSESQSSKSPIPAFPEQTYEPREEIRETESIGTVTSFGDYYIQVASFIKKENADRMAEKLRQKMYKVIVEQAEVEGKTFHRVRVGPFETKGIATNTMIAMRRRFDLEDPFVLKKNS